MSESHSKFSASAASRWLSCPGSMVLSAGLPDSSSAYAAEGTCAHLLLERCLKEGRTECYRENWLGEVHEVDGHIVVISDDMLDAVDVAVTNIREMTTGADIVLGESRVNYAEWLGVDRDTAWGTSDVVAVVGTELQVHDYKHGMGVAVDAKQNEQLMLYAGGALSEYQDLADIQSIRMVIHQPRVKKAPSEWSISVDELATWLTGRARSGAASVLVAEREGRLSPEFQSTFLHPSEKGCRWCKAKATCPALRAAVFETVTGEPAPATPEDFETVAPAKIADSSDVVGFCLSKVDMIEDWCKAIRAEAERRLLVGEPVPGFKLVQGKRGNRQWSNATEAEAMLKTFRLKQEEMYEFKLISPTTAGKLAKAETIGKRQWPKLAALITQSEGKPSVAPASDPRPAIEIRPIDDEFTTQADDIC